MDVPKTMRAVEISAPGGPEVLRPAERDVPRPCPGEVLVQAKAVGLNRPDVFQRQGLYRAPPDASDLPGLEACGTIAEVGPNVSVDKIGQNVMAILPGGGYAEYAVTSADHCLPVPENLSVIQAAGLPEALFTVWYNVFQRAGLRPGERFLVHGGTSGIGTTAIQMACAWGARVFATAGSDEKCAVCRDLGAEAAINYRTKDFVDQIRGHGGANVILDIVGGSYIQRNLKSLADDGRLVQIAFIESTKAEVNLAQVMLRRLTITGSTLRPLGIETKAGIARDVAQHILPLVEAGRIRPVIDSTFALDDAAAAHRRLEDPDHIGKIVLTV